MKTKTEFDAVGMVRAIMDAHFESLKHKSPAEKIAFFRQKARRINERLEARHHKTASMKSKLVSA
jgi:hypothetical protein